MLERAQSSVPLSESGHVAKQDPHQKAILKISRKSQCQPSRWGYQGGQGNSQQPLLRPAKLGNPLLPTSFSISNPRVFFLGGFLPSSSHPLARCPILLALRFRRQSELRVPGHWSAATWPFLVTARHHTISGDGHFRPDASRW